VETWADGALDADASPEQPAFRWPFGGPAQRRRIQPSTGGSPA
jgi:hypothetical protein